MLYLKHNSLNLWSAIAHPTRRGVDAGWLLFYKISHGTQLELLSIQKNHRGTFFPPKIQKELLCIMNLVKYSFSTFVILREGSFLSTQPLHVEDEPVLSLSEELPNTVQRKAITTTSAITKTTFKRDFGSEVRQLISPASFQQENLSRKDLGTTTLL